MFIACYFIITCLLTSFFQLGAEFFNFCIPISKGSHVTENRHVVIHHIENHVNTAKEYRPL